MQDQDNDAMQNMTILSLDSNGKNYDTAEWNDTKSNHSRKNAAFSSAVQSNSSKTISIDGNPVVLGAFCYKNQDRSKTWHPLSNQFFQKPSANINELNDIDLTYVIECRFCKNGAKS